MTASTTVPSLELANGVRIPQLGFGVFQIPPEDTAALVAAAISGGYRHIDTAQGYRNEREVMKGIERSGIDPAEVFVTSKLGNAHITAEAAAAAIEGTAAAFGEKQVDLFLLHWPLATVRDFMIVWRELERAYEEGRFRAVGVSNFHVQHLERLEAEARVRPVVNQLELHPYLTQSPLRSYNQAHGMVTEAWSPLAQGLVLRDPEILRIAEETGRSAAQVVLRWHIQIGDVVFPKSTSPARMAENFALFDGWSLSGQQVDAISALNRDERTGGDPDTFRYTF